MMIMKLMSPIRPISPMRPMRLIALMGLMALMGLQPVMAQEVATSDPIDPIIVNGNIYGGGNKGKVNGNTTVTVMAGDLNKVFGGARMAQVGGRAFVNIDGENATDDAVINYVFGGNDISGTIGTAAAVPEELTEVIPEPTEEQLAATETTPAKTREAWRKDYKTAHPDKNDVDNNWNAFVRISSKMVAEAKYTQEECDEYNAELEGAVSTQDINQETEDYYTEEEANAYNATLPGAKTTDDIKTPATVAADNKKIYIGQLFGGGNGEYTYEKKQGTTNTYDVYRLPKTDGDAALATITTATGSATYKPELDKTYLEICGGSIVYAYGGGNNATVRENTTICVNNPSDVVNSITRNYAKNETNTTGELLTNSRFLNDMGINIGLSQPSSDKFQIGRFFGGNNQAEMSIRPIWNLLAGKIRNLYSGGNKGAMTHTEGLLLEIPAISTITVDNVYGGCRMADIHPLLSGTLDGEYTEVKNPEDVQLHDTEGHQIYSFPPGLAARVLIRGGDINNVYGGNDVTGTVFGGNAVGIYTSIRGNVYGGGNGSYPYTDNYNITQHKQLNAIYGDLYYGEYNSAEESLKALNNYRPNTEQVSLRLVGTDAEHPTIIGGSVYVGGNSATLKTGKTKPKVELKIGSHVIADNVFLGNNGENMVDEEILKYYKGSVSWDSENENVVDITGNSGYKYSNIDLTSTTKIGDKTQMDLYMDGVILTLEPDVVFDTDPAHGGSDPSNYEPYSSYFGSFFCGGNVGSMRYNGTTTIRFNYPVIIYDKLVGGCNKAYIPAKSSDNNQLCIAYDGGLLGNAGNNPKLMLNLSGLRLQPKRWKVKRKGADGEDYNTKILDDANGNVIYLDKDDNPVTSLYQRTLEWNTVAEVAEVIGGVTELVVKEVAPVTSGTGNASPDDLARRFTGGNIYGGCYESGHVNGNVVINIDGSIVDRYGEHGVFDSATPDPNENADILYGHDNYTITTRRSGVILDKQGMDALGTSLNVFGGGYGVDSEIWGSTTVNLNKGYVFQIFGGGEQGAIGKGTRDEYGILDYQQSNYDPKYSCTINVNSEKDYLTFEENKREEQLAECEFIYGGGFEGLIMGDTRINLGNGYIFNTFAGSCYADILGHTETYVGEWIDVNGQQRSGFPWVRDRIYGGNDLGGRIINSKSFVDRVRNNTVLSQVYGKQVSNAETTYPVLNANAYMEYTQGHIVGIFGGHYGDYDYTGEYQSYTSKPYLKNAFVNFRPNNTSDNFVKEVFGGSQGGPSDPDRDKMQDQSYVLIDIPTKVENFKDMRVFGGGDFCGIGMGIARNEAEANADLVTASAVIDLINGHIDAAYGGSFNEGITRRTIVNVPEESTINIKNIFGGAYGIEVLPPCDVYESNVNYWSEKARLTGAIYGGNNNQRRTLYTHVNIHAPVWSNKESNFLGKVYGAGKGESTWSEYTEVNLHENAKVYEAYGGGEMGHVLNAESVQEYMELFSNEPTENDARDGGEMYKLIKDSGWAARWGTWANAWKDAWTLGDYYTPDNNDNIAYADNPYTNLSNSLVSIAEMDERDHTDPKNKEINRNKYNTNVLIHKGATIEGYAYGGGWGSEKVAKSGDVYGTTYIALLGGIVEKDIYAAGTSGNVDNLFGAETFIASANAYIKGGSVRNVYGGGWKGSVGYHPSITEKVNGKDSTFIYAGLTTNDILGETHVVIGRAEQDIRTDSLSRLAALGETDVFPSTVYYGRPSIQRNVYGGGEGGAVYGTANLTIRNGYVGYRYDETATDDPTTPNFNEQYIEELSDNGSSIDLAGNAFGGGYVTNSYVDATSVKMYGGVLRGSLYGGGEIGPVGRGTLETSFIPSGGIKTIEVEGYKATIYKPGATHVYMYGGHVMRDVFGGGRGYSSWGNDGYRYDSDRIGKDLSAKGYVFGTTDVNIHYGEVGTEAGVALGYGNVFGGGNAGFVFGAGTKATDTSNNKTIGYYYDNDNHLTEDCRVEVKTFGVAKNTCSFDYTFSVGEAISEEVREKLISTSDYETNYKNKITGNRVTTSFTANLTYNKGEFVHNRVLNTMPFYDGTGGTEGRWLDIDQSGVTIHNSVFAGGNVMTGSNEVFAYSKTVFGNATAAIVDVYSRDMTSIGGDGVGGLYGDGNITYVDGYRELNISNYGTDYFSLPGQLNLSNQEDLDKFNALTPRQKDFYITKYQLVSDNVSYTIDGNPVVYKKGDIITAKDYEKLNEIDQTHASDWVAKHSVINEGRYINTIQRADFCGIKGSRLVLRGAIDRAQDKNEADYTLYTINRVKELSLNQNNVLEKHGCYFGIYNSVKLLGAITSDVPFYVDNAYEQVMKYDAIRKTDSDKDEDRETVNGKGYGTATYWDWKQAKLDIRNRNNGSSPNKIALASGVYLELVEGFNGTEKIYGPITGVVELDLLNVTPGEGGGYVYAKNIHGAPSYDPAKRIASVLSDANQGLITNRAYSYATAVSADKMQTSGNFINSRKRIIDDCYPMSHSYVGPYNNPETPAHYWYIRGEFFVYEQLVSAYTGGADAYSTEISIPLTLSAQGNGRLRLMNVLPGLYADPTGMNYHYDPDDEDACSSDSISIIYENAVKKYGQNDPISYWDWYMANNADRSKFILQTYNCREQVTYNNTTYYPGQGISYTVYNQLPTNIYVCKESFTIGEHEYIEGDQISDTDYDALEDNKSKFVPFKSYYFNPTNVVSNDSAYVLTLDLSNPNMWNDYYTVNVDDDANLGAYGTLWDTRKFNEELAKITSEDEKKAFIDKFLKSATFKCTQPGTYGQYSFNEGAIISKTVYDMQTEAVVNGTQATQATFVDAYVASRDEMVINDHHYTKNSPIAPGDISSIPDALVDSCKAYICVSTVMVGNKDYRVLNEVISKYEYDHLPENYNNVTIKSNFQPAYYCTGDGSWGGIYYEANKNYSGVDYCKVLPSERQHFTYNYDALDLLVTDYAPYYVKTNGVFDPAASLDALKAFVENGGTAHNSQVSQFNGTLAQPRYSVSIPIDYTATFNGTGFNGKHTFVLKKPGDETSDINVTENTKLTSDQFERLPNDRLNYAAFSVTEDNKDTDGKYYVYIVKNTFDQGGEMYNAGMVLKKDEYDKLGGSSSSYLDKITITSGQRNDNMENGKNMPFFYCFVQDDKDGNNQESYTVGTKDGNIDGLTTPSFQDLNNVTYGIGTTENHTVPQGTILDYNNFSKIPNYQEGFEVKGEIPVEEATLYVPVKASIEDLQKDRYVTVIYEYTYTESDNKGLSYETRVEKHIINLRIKFESGAPHIGPINDPNLVLPLEAVNIEAPFVEEGAFPVLSSGWQIFASEEEAKKHINGREFANNSEPVYYYQNNYHVAYYAETHMGRTFSNPVRVTVGNYHRMADVINDAHHMYINHKDIGTDPDPKIYIDNRTVGTKGTGEEERSYNELDAMQDMWTIVNGTFGGNPTGTNTGTYYKRDITGAKGLDFILQSEVNTTLNNWTPIGDETTCFQGRFHGNGNTIKGLNNSLFGKLCGDVYNTGVMGSFASGGIANSGEGRIENCWASSTAATGKAVIGDPSGTTVINSYYPSEDNFVAHSSGVDIKPRGLTDFVNGAVAYDLNRYYLEARYRLFKEEAGDYDNYLYYRLPDGTLKQELTTDKNGVKPSGEGYIETYGPKLYNVKYNEADYARFTDNHWSYVENYYADGDFRFSDGLKPHTADMRLNQKQGYVPIYPDDYIFFGQKLTYDLLKDDQNMTISHVSHPQAVAKSHSTGSNDLVDNSKHGLLINDANDKSENRLYRAPAYFRNGTPGRSVLFNAHAVFTDSYKINDETVVRPHQNLTAIDFTGGNGDTHGYQGVVAGIASDYKNRENGYKPLLDFERLDGFTTNGITKNLLAYTPTADKPNTKNTQTNNVLNHYFSDQAYAELNTTVIRPEYHAVARQTKDVRGHIVQQDALPDNYVDGSETSYNYTALTDHFLVDKQDFNAPISYTFDVDKRMWYQRTPDNYAETVWDEDTRTTTGWEGVSIPFEAEIVTTDQKGEITHFYRKDTSGKYEDDYNTGHEYWLRGFEGVDKDDAATTDIIEATFLAPLKNTSSGKKTDENTFLWYYYYTQNEWNDHNEDTYKEYYKTSREYPDYPRLTKGTPYIIAFPSEQYYEFDLSGQFKPEYTHNDNNPLWTDPATKINRQTITFASAASTAEKPVVIQVSDSETNGIDNGGYTFMPSYLNDTYSSNDANTFVLNNNGSSFDWVDVDGEVTSVVRTAFRPYFKKTTTGGAPRRIVINGGSNTIQPDIEEHHGSNSDEDGGLKISVDGREIVVESTLRGNAPVRISTTSGITIRAFMIEPGQIVRTPVNMTGVYIVNRKKLLVK